MSFSCEKFLNIIVCYRKHGPLGGHGPPGSAMIVPYVEARAKPEKQIDVQNNLMN